MPMHLSRAAAMITVSKCPCSQGVFFLSPYLYILHEDVQNRSYLLLHMVLI